jgi:hypothetical protein
LRRAVQHAAAAEEEVMALRIQGVTPDRKLVSSIDLKVHIPQQPPKKRWR